MQQFDSNKQKEKVYSSLVLVGVIGSVMLFAGLSSAVLKIAIKRASIKPLVSFDVNS